jgi:hypothetical protein
MSVPSFHYSTDDQGNRVYDDSDVQRVYVNLKRLSDFVGACQTRAELEYTYICQNVSADGNTSTALSFLVNLLVGGFEFMGDIEFPWAGKTGGKIAGWLLSALVDTWRDEPPEPLQQDFNNVWNGTKAAYDQTKLTVDGWRENLGPDVWTTERKCPDGSVVAVSQLATVGYLPDTADTEFDLGAIAVANQSRYLMNKILVPTRWCYVETGDANWWDSYYTRWNSSHPYDGPFYDGLSVQCAFGVCTSFPDMDIVDAQEQANHYVYFSKEYAEEYDHNWFSNDRLYKGQKYRRWNLQNRNGGTAPDAFITYLFKDGPGGDSVNGIAARDDVFANWGLKSQMVVPQVSRVGCACVPN